VAASLGKHPGRVVAGLPFRAVRCWEKPVDRVRVLLADDHAAFLAFAAQLLEPEFEVVEQVGDGQASLVETARLQPDILVLDISMPVLNGLEAAQRLRASGSAVKVVFLSVHEDADYVREAVAAGALGYVIKCRIASDLLPALRAAAAGRAFFSPGLSQD
jgi:DNA-binding NarL/FixJ family response regulator